MLTRDRPTFPQRLRRAGRDAVDFLYPPACAFCQRPIADSLDPPNGVVAGLPIAVVAGLPTEPHPHCLCADCSTSVAPILTDRCFRCSAPVGPHLDTTRGCIHCQQDRFAFDRVVSLGVYNAQLRSAVLSVKRHSGDVLAATLADLLVAREPVMLDRARVDLIVPVPHHWTDRLLRRHLPPATLATRLARLLNTPWTPHILAKARRTRPQAELSGTARRANLRGAFRLIGRPRLDGLRVLLVDDVLTTGTTAHRAAALLKKAGATVNVVVLARGLGLGAATPSAAQPPSATATINHYSAPVPNPTDP